MLVAPTVKVGGLEYQMGPGDIINTNETPVTIALDAIYTYLGPELAQGDIYRTLMTAGRADVFPSANQLIDALRGSLNIITPPANELYGIQPSRAVQLAWPANLMPFGPGSSFRRIITATTAFALAMAAPAAGAGLTIAAAPYDQVTVAASSWREFVFQILNSSPAVTIACAQTNALFTLTINNSFIDLANSVTAGMSVFGTNIAAGSKVTAVNRDTGVITISLAVTATIGVNAISFTPTVVVQGLRAGTK